MKVKFTNGVVIEIPPSVNVTEYLYRNHPQFVREYAEYLQHANHSFREIDAKSKYLKFHNNNQ